MLEQVVGIAAGLLVAGIVAAIVLRRMGAVEARAAEVSRGYRLLFENNPAPMFVYEKRTLRFLAVNEAALAYYGFTRDEFATMTLIDIRPVEDVPALMKNVADSHDRLERSTGWRHRLKDGSLREVEITSHSIDFEGRDARHVMVTDVTEKARAIKARDALADRLTHQSLHDGLTGLANRTLLLDRIEHAIARTQRSKSPLAVMFFDIDGFKRVNEAFGSAVGDLLLMKIADRMRRELRPEDTVARVGADEFGILLEDTELARTKSVADRIFSAIRTPVDIGDETVKVRMSAGIAFNNGSGTGQELLRQADVARQAAKDRGRDRYELFEPGMQEVVLKRARLLTELEKAVSNQELRLVYQPIISLSSSQITSLEGLVRWDHPKDGVVMPEDFIPLAEETELICTVGSWVLEEALQQTGRWRADSARLSNLAVSVNVSPRQLQDPKMDQEIARMISVNGLEAGNVTLEITETRLLEDFAWTVRKLQELRDLGVKIAIDDFGTGYSSLSYLQRLPVDILKIDKSFVDGITKGPEEAALAQGIVRLGHSLNLLTVAEGIEHEDQADALREWGCDYGQGFFFSKPLDVPGVADMLANAS
ncbi:MAG TPA: EAL domain-containing protein [Actinomycetota bacterium]|nr:EAL domain-containing protein [Actinomycetota bacterium]